jgi:transposase-like protein
VTTTQRQPRNLLEAVHYFSDPDVALDFVVKLRWPNGVECPSCGGTEHSFLKTRRIWKCRECKRQFSAKVGTIFEDSPIGFDKWLPAVWLIVNSKNGVSSHELGRSIGVTQKTAWFMDHRIRYALKVGSFNKLDGEVEVDETFIGGLARNMHKVDRARRIHGTGGLDKTMVVGTLQRTNNGVPSRVIASVLPDRTHATLHAYIGANVVQGATIYSDQHKGYTGLEADYSHKVVDHAVEYVSGRVYTNGIENFWALLKRGLKGTYVCAQPYHLHRYIDERVFTFNERDKTDLGRMQATVSQVAGRRVTWKQLTGKEVVTHDGELPEVA